MRELEPSEGCDLINVQHGVVLAVIFGYLIYPRPFSFLQITGNICTSDIFCFLSSLFSSSLPLLYVFSVIFYYFIDWLTINFARKKYKFTAKFVLVGSLSIWCLGFIIVFGIKQSDWKYLLAGLYYSVIGFLDSTYGPKNFSFISKESRARWDYLSNMKLMFGFSITLISGISKIFDEQNLMLSSMATVLSWLVTLIKYWRFNLLRSPNVRRLNK